MQSMVDGVMALLPDADPGTVQAFAAVVTFAITLILAKLARRSAKAAEDMVKHLEAADRLGRLPLVVLDFVPQPGKDTGYFVATNVGLGAALNAFEIDSLDAVKPATKRLGSFPSQHSTPVPPSLNTALSTENQGDQARYIVVSEPVTGEEWQVSTNLVDADRRVRHTKGIWRPTAAQRDHIHKPTFKEQIGAAYRERIGEQPGGTGVPKIG